MRSKRKYDEKSRASYAIKRALKNARSKSGLTVSELCELNWLLYKPRLRIKIKALSAMLSCDPRFNNGFSVDNRRGVLYLKHRGEAIARVSIL